MLTALEAEWVSQQMLMAGGWGCHYGAGVLGVGGVRVVDDRATVESL